MMIDENRRVFLVALGTHGDILPVIALGAALQARGHQVYLAAPEPFMPLAARAGLLFHAIGTSADFEHVIRQPALWHPIRGARIMLKAIAKAIEPTYRWLEAEVCPGTDLVVASTLALGARVAQERLGLTLTTFT